MSYAHLLKAQEFFVSFRWSMQRPTESFLLNCISESHLGGGIVLIQDLYDDQGDLNSFNEDFQALLLESWNILKEVEPSSSLMDDEKIKDFKFWQDRTIGTVLTPHAITAKSFIPAGQEKYSYNMIKSTHDRLLQLEGRLRKELSPNTIVYGVKGYVHKSGDNKQLTRVNECLLLLNYYSVLISCSICVQEALFFLKEVKNLANIDVIKPLESDIKTFSYVDPGYMRDDLTDKNRLISNDKTTFSASDIALHKEKVNQKFKKLREDINNNVPLDERKSALDALEKAQTRFNSKCEVQFKYPTDTGSQKTIKVARYAIKATGIVLGIAGSIVLATAAATTLGPSIPMIAIGLMVSSVALGAVALTIKATNLAYFRGLGESPSKRECIYAIAKTVAKGVGLAARAAGGVICNLMALGAKGVQFAVKGEQVHHGIKEKGREKAVLIGARARLKQAVQNLKDFREKNNPESNKLPGEEQALKFQDIKQQLIEEKGQSSSTHQHIKAGVEELSEGINRLTAP